MHLEYIIDTTGLIYLAVFKSVAEMILTLTHFDWYQKNEVGNQTKRRWDDALSKL
jgi:hypothetical protein